MELVSLQQLSQPIDDAEAVAAYLDAGAVLWVAASRRRSRSCGSMCDPLPAGTASDGVFAWPLDAGHRVRSHGEAPAHPLLDRIRRRGYSPPVLCDGEAARLRLQLRRRGAASGTPAHPRPDDGADADPFA